MHIFSQRFVENFLAFFLHIPGNSLKLHYNLVHQSNATTMKNEAEVLLLSIVVRSPKPLPIWKAGEPRPFPDLFPGIFSVEHHLRSQNQYLVSCSPLSIFSVAGDLCSLAEAYEASQTEVRDLTPLEF